LPDAGFAREQEEAPATGERVVEAGGELRELALAADDRAPRRIRRRRVRGRWLELRILPENRFGELTKLTAGLYAELAHERSPGRPIGLERLGLATCAIQTEHQRPAKALVQRAFLDQRVELGQRRDVTAEANRRLDRQLLVS
jgi:hypothetical protein